MLQSRYISLTAVLEFLGIGAGIFYSTRTYGWTKGPARHRKTWWCNDDFDNSVSEKCTICKEWKQENTNKEKFLKVKNEAKKTV